MSEPREGLYSVLRVLRYPGRRVHLTPWRMCGTWVCGQAGVRSRVRSRLRGGLAGMVWGLHIRQGPAYISEHTASGHNCPHRPRQRAVIRHVDITGRACSAVRGRGTKLARERGPCLRAVVRHVPGLLRTRSAQPGGAQSTVRCRTRGSVGCARSSYYVAHLHAAQLAGTAGHPVCVCGVRDLGIDTRIVRPAYRHARHAVFRNT